MSVLQTDMGCDVHADERFVRRGHEADLTSLLEIAYGQAGHDMGDMFRLWSEVCNILYTL